MMFAQNVCSVQFDGFQFHLTATHLLPQSLLHSLNIQWIYRQWIVVSSTDEWSQLMNAELKMVGEVGNDDALSSVSVFSSHRNHT